MTGQGNAGGNAVAAATHVDKLAYAAALLDGAYRLIGSEREPALDKIGIPFYLLIGFGIENALKALLQYQSAPGSWKHSHDLAGLLALTSGLDAKLWPGAAADIKKLSRYHQEHWFRYPEKASTANVYKPRSAAMLLDHLIGVVFKMTGTTAASLKASSPRMAP